MSINLIETIQNNLHYPPLQKIDPNTQEVKADDKKPNEDRFSQAAIPAILTVLYKYSTTDAGAEDILGGDNSTIWANLFMDETKDEVVNKIAAYSFQSGEYTQQHLESISAEAVRLIKETLKPGAAKMDVKDFMAEQRNHILLYLPEALHMGTLLNDDTLDDNTNKMEGPVSSLMRKIGAAFSKPASEEELHTNQ